MMKAKRVTKWFVYCELPGDNSWESGHRHLTKESAEQEIKKWSEYGVDIDKMRTRRVIYFKNDEN